MKTWAALKKERAPPVLGLKMRPKRKGGKRRTASFQESLSEPPTNRYRGKRRDKHRDRYEKKILLDTGRRKLGFQGKKAREKESRSKMSKPHGGKDIDYLAGEKRKKVPAGVTRTTRRI